ncbi:MAG: Dam family site-specific DNA-(adenine-N6)-methyltransferase [Alteromonadaceae bacterium]|nr:Dam family site-specific DNA-(adenine-N6)-methyltransferase [Alteromonadaceae bacterium]
MPKSCLSNDMRSPLKWAGGKKRILQQIDKILPSAGKKRLVEPFVGGGSVFLNFDFDEYLLCDSNQDLIAFYNVVKADCDLFIKEARKLFTDKNNQAERYYLLRDKFNRCKTPLKRAALFLYLNRHGYNGLCRYNQKGGYNVPFGRFKKPYFPEAELLFLGERAQRATFIVGDFNRAFEQTTKMDVVYCDPPYSPINRTANFTTYSGISFLDDDQNRLVSAAQEAQSRGVATLISNHFVPFTKALYASADKTLTFSVQRSISQNGSNRQRVKEVLALYRA